MGFFVLQTMTRHLQLQGMVAGPLAGFQAPLRIFWLGWMVCMAQIFVLE